MLNYIYSAKFKAVADVKSKALLIKGTFEYTSILKTDNTVPLLVMWVFTYKFNKDRYLLKHKVRLVARRDL